MTRDLVWALVAALILGAASVVFAKPRNLVTAWARGLTRRVLLRLYLQNREDTQRAIERIAAELTQCRCAEEGNPDDEYESDWCTAGLQATQTQTWTTPVSRPETLSG
jgi:uncharacterized protein HemX